MCTVAKIADLHEPAGAAKTEETYENNFTSEKIFPTESSMRSKNIERYTILYELHTDAKLRFADTSKKTTTISCKNEI